MALCVWAIGARRWRVGPGRERALTCQQHDVRPLSCKIATGGTCIEAPHVAASACAWCWRACVGSRRPSSADSFDIVGVVAKLRKQLKIIGCVVGEVVDVAIAPRLQRGDLVELVVGGKPWAWREIGTCGHPSRP